MPTPRIEETTTGGASDAPRVTCRGLSPDPRRRGQSCRRLLAIVPDHRFRYVGLAARAAEHPARYVYVLCTRCHVWNVFELVLDEVPAA